jgi:hypothetical protein
VKRTRQQVVHRVCLPVHALGVTRSLDPFALRDEVIASLVQASTFHHYTTSYFSLPLESTYVQNYGPFRSRRIKSKLRSEQSDGASSAIAGVEPGVESRLSPYHIVLIIWNI